MKYTLQTINTGKPIQYRTEKETWTEDRKQAKEFKTKVKARRWQARCPRPDHTVIK